MRDLRVDAMVARLLPADLLDELRCGPHPSRYRCQICLDEGGLIGGDPTSLVPGELVGPVPSHALATRRQGRDRAAPAHHPRRVASRRARPRQPSGPAHRPDGPVHGRPCPLPVSRQPACAGGHTRSSAAAAFAVAKAAGLGRVAAGCVTVEWARPV
ncbi:hypothetical protein [Pseudofrankia sp. DC12]|uniref:hypothetical protein n=1 Tax=Pseudofrankia sp. DC12 TaxID=683315 RepID=UPI0005F7AEC6|nr:hypothetical protein [Pseudofrankia sp. DC12]